ncbi:MAG TPA: gluconokinase [Methylomirabilota bacterium]|nr:gluconokinase [Methylomirabilota bacterium]
MKKPLLLILMGVAGAGKTTIGTLLAREPGWAFYDGDDFHPQANIEKMRRGIALTDADRAAWLTALRQLIERLLRDRQSAVIACSALKQAYRDRLRDQNAEVRFVYLKGDYELIRQRLQARRAHFMKTDLLASQFDALEEPRDVLTIEAAQEPETIVALIKQHFGL